MNEKKTKKGMKDKSCFVVESDFKKKRLNGGESSSRQEKTDGRPLEER